MVEVAVGDVETSEVGCVDSEIFGERRTDPLNDGEFLNVGPVG